jgi:hypothetical protein
MEKMDHAALYDALDSTREQLLVLLEPLSDAQLLLDGVIGDWSVRDMLFHLTIWEAELVTGLMKIHQGQKPTRLLAAMSDRHGQNAAHLAENPDRDLDRIFDDLQGARFHLEDWLEQFSARDLQDRRRYQWSDGKPLWQIIAENSYQHEATHLPDLERLVTQTSPSHIGLDNIDVFETE